MTNGGQDSQDDAGLRAVERVREVRERDTRLEVGDAVRERGAAQVRVRRIEDRLREPATVDGDSADLVMNRTTLLNLHHALMESRANLADCEQRALDAIGRWNAARADLAAVESLLERRAAARAEWLRRREQLELDDVAGRLWLRARRADDDGGASA